MADSAIKVLGLAKFRRDLETIDHEWAQMLKGVHKKIADRAALGARGIAIGMGGIQAKAAGAIYGKATAQRASIGVATRGNMKFANAAFWGAGRRFGWYSKPQYKGHGYRQFDPWVGNTWSAATFDGGPYAINRALFFDLPDLLDDYRAGIAEITSKAFPI